MGNKLWGINISGIIAKEVGRGVLDGTLMRLVPGTRTAGALTAGTNPSRSSAKFKGFVEQFSQNEVDGTNVREGDFKVIILGDTLPNGVVPKSKDEVRIEGSTAEVIRVIGRDPAKATYTVQAR